MLYYIDNNAQLTFYSLLSCNVTIQHYEKYIRIGKVRVLLFRVLHLRRFFLFFLVFPFVFFFRFTSFGGKRPDITEREDTYNRRETLQSEKLQIGTEKRKCPGVLFLLVLWLTYSYFVCYKNGSPFGRAEQEQGRELIFHFFHFFLPFFLCFFLFLFFGFVWLIRLGFVGPGIRVQGNGTLFLFRVSMHKLEFCISASLQIIQMYVNIVIIIIGSLLARKKLKANSSSVTIVFTPC